MPHKALSKNGIVLCVLHVLEVSSFIGNLAFLTTLSIFKKQGTVHSTVLYCTVLYCTVLYLVYYVLYSVQYCVRVHLCLVEDPHAAMIISKLWSIHLGYQDESCQGWI